MGSRILIIEHQDSDYRDVMRSVTKAGHELLFAAHAEGGVAAARRHRPHIVLCAMAPPSSGLQVLHGLRRDPSFDQVPIVAVTRYSDPGDRDSLLGLGFAGVIGKPLSATLVQQIEGFLPR